MSFFFHSLFYPIFFLILLLLPETLRWRMGKQRFPLMWKSREMYWWWSIMQDLRWGDVCRPRYVHTSFGAAHMNHSVSHKKTWYKWRKGDFFIKFLSCFRWHQWRCFRSSSIQVLSPEMRLMSSLQSMYTLLRNAVLLTKQDYWQSKF